MAALLLMALVGAVAGFMIKRLTAIRLSERHAIALGVAGAVVGAILARWLLPAVLLILAAAAGAALTIWAVERYRNRVT